MARRSLIKANPSAIAEVARSGTDLFKAVLDHPAVAGFVGVAVVRLAYKGGLFDPRVIEFGARDEPARGYFRAFVPPEFRTVTKDWWWDPAPYNPPWPPQPTYDPETDPRFQGLERLPEGTIFTHLCGIDNQQVCLGGVNLILVRQTHNIPPGADLEQNYIQDWDVSSYYYQGRLVARSGPSGYWPTPEPNPVLGHWRVERITPWTQEPIPFPGYTQELLDGGTDMNNKPAAVQTWEITTGGYYWDSPIVDEGSKLLVTAGSPHAQYWHEWHRTQDPVHIPGDKKILYREIKIDNPWELWHWGTNKWTKGADELNSYREIMASKQCDDLTAFVIGVSAIYAGSKAISGLATLFNPR